MTSGDPPSSPQKSRTALLVANTDWYLFNFRLNLIKAAEHEGWHVQFAAPDTGYFQRLQTKGYRGHQVPLASAGLNPWHEFKALITLARTFRRVKPDVIHLFTLKCVLYGCLTAPLARRARVIGAVTGMGHLFTTKSWRTRLLKTPVLIALKAGLKISGAHLIFQNRADRDEFVDHRLIPRERTTVIRGSGVDCARFQPALQRRETNSTPRLLFCGRLIAEKGIHAFALHPGGINTNLGRHMSEEEMAGLMERIRKSAEERGEEPEPFKTIPQGAATTCWVATTPALEGRGGLYCEDCHVAEQDDQDTGGGVRSYAIDRDKAERLWELSEKMVGQTFAY